MDYIFWMQQVLSQSVANAFKMRGEHDIATFVELFDKFFDGVNANERYSSSPTVLQQISG